MLVLARRRIARETGGRVLQGPFKGLEYHLPRSVGSALEPKLLGTYELELHAAVEDMVGRRPRTLINVGAAEGFYSVGLARRLPELKVIAFETDPDGQALALELARRNGVEDRLAVHGHCDQATLARALGDAAQPVTILVDVEGFEGELLDLDSMPQLARADLLVEIHEWLTPGVRRTIEERFAATHHVRTFEQQRRTEADLPFRDGLLNPWLLRLLDEHRPRRAFPMTWLLLEARERAPS